MISTPAILGKYKRPRPWALSQEIMWCNEAASEPHCGSNDEAATGNKADTVIPYLGFGPKPATQTQGLKTLHFPTPPPPNPSIAVMPQERDHSRSWFRVAVL
jgi:hypothetical protein